MKPFLLFAFLLFLCSHSFSQTYKNQWLVGGSGSFSAKNTTDGFNKGFKENGFTVRPNAGYFILNNLAVGVRGSYDYSHIKSPNYDSSYTVSKNHSIGVSPFVRCYVLPTGKKLNVLADASYGWHWSTYHFPNGIYKQKANGFEVAAGPVLFLSPAIALELLADYQHTNADAYNSTFSINIGFEIHLGKKPLPERS